MKIFLRILLLSLLLPNSSWAVNLIWADYPDGRLYKIDLSTQSLFMETSPNVWVNLGKISANNINENDFPPVVRVNSFESDSDKQSRTFLIDCTNQVYRFSFKTRLLERIDKTYFRGYNCLATNFMRKDTLFNFGGYGFWQTTNVQTYFKNSTKEWEGYSPKNDAPQAINDGLNGYIPQKDIFFSAFNTYHNDSENEGKPQVDKGVYVFSFKDKTWQKKGEINASNFKELEANETKIYMFWTGKYFLTKFYDMPHTKIHLADPITNQLFTWTDNKKLFNLFNHIIDDPEHEMFKVYCWHDTLYLYNQEENKNNEIRKIRISINQLKRESVSIGSFYGSGTNWWGILIGMLFCAVLVFLGYRYWLGRNQKQEIESSNGRQLSWQFTKQEQLILREMMNKQEEGGVEVNYFNELLAISYKATDNQRKIRNDVIKSLSIKLPSITNLEENIIRTQLEEDKRSHRYLLTNEAFELLKGLTI